MRHLLLAFSLLACGTGVTEPGEPPPPAPGAGLKIVMLGNSLSYYNDMPAMIAELAALAGEPRPSVSVEAHANYGLEDHLSDAGSLTAMDDPSVDVLILQQGPSTLPASGANLLQYATAIADRVAKHGTRVGMYVAWPPIGGDIDAGVAHDTAAANARNMAIYPVGHAFRHLRNNFPELPVLGTDEFHPNYSGSWLAAMIITAVIYDHDPLEYPNLFPRQIPAAHEATLRATAKLVVDNYGRR
jgi:hypothetical protein